MRTQDNLNNQISILTRTCSTALPKEDTHKESPTVEEIQGWLVHHLVELLEIDPDDVAVTIPFDRYGMDSATAVGLTGDLEDWLGCELEPTLLYDYSTIEALANYLVKESHSLRPAYQVTHHKTDPHFVQKRGDFSPIKQTLARHLEDIVLRVPYNSISQFYTYFGGTPADARFGLSCVWQSFELGRRLVQAGFEKVRYFVSGRHIALICETDEGEFLLDPYLLHTEPVQLNRASCSSKEATYQVSVEAYPYRQSNDDLLSPSQLQVSWNQNTGTIHLEYLRFSVSKNCYIKSRYFKLDLAHPLENVPLPADIIRPLLFHHEQNNLSIRVVDGEDNSMSELLYPIALYHGDNEISVDRLVVRNNQGEMFSYNDQEQFVQITSKIARTLDTSEESLFTFVLDGVEIYERFAPAKIDYIPFQLKNE